MSDSEKKKGKILVRPGPVPKQTSAKMPVRPAFLPVAPVIIPSRASAISPTPPRAAVPKPHASMPPKPRVDTSVGSFEALAGKAFPTFEERAAASGCVRVVVKPPKNGSAVAACITAPYEEPVYFADAEISYVPGPRPTNAQIQAFRREGYRYSRETAKLGDLAGRRTVVHGEAEGVIAESEIQPDVPVHWFMSPDIPAWKSRAVPTECVGQASSRADSDRGEESFKAIFDGPSAELVTKLHAARWPQYFVDQRGTEETATLLAEELWDAIAVEEFRRADRRLEYAFAIGAARFARLWNLALSDGTIPTTPAEPTAEDAIVESVAIETDVTLTS